MKPKKLILIPILITFLAVAFLCAAAAPKSFGVVPAPDGGYPNLNTAEGQNALFSLTTGAGNTAVGWFSLKSNAEASFNTATGAGALLFNIADENTATGAGALLSNTEGTGNSANGAFALFFNTTGLGDTAVGRGALFSNTTGNFNTANGSDALFSNTEGSSNTAAGAEALYNNTTGTENSAFGAGALASNTTGSFNTATGVQALGVNSTGGGNTATGYQALFSNTIGANNTAQGFFALLNNAGGSDNTAIGYGALFDNITGVNNTALGLNALLNTTGNGNIAVGHFAGQSVTTADNVICIGNDGANVSDTTWIRNIYGTTTVSGNTLPVIVSSTGQLGTAASSRRFKKEIRPMEQTSEAILGLKPVTFHYKSDNSSRPQFGLIAEEVAEVNPDLVVHDENGDIYTVRYDAVNAMLLNEFLKEHRKVEEQQLRIGDLEANAAKQEATISELTESIAVLTVQLKEQANQIQKVSAQIEMSKPPTRVAFSQP